MNIYSNENFNVCTKPLKQNVLKTFFKRSQDVRVILRFSNKILFRRVLRKKTPDENITKITVFIFNFRHK